MLHYSTLHCTNEGRRQMGNMGLPLFCPLFFGSNSHGLPEDIHGNCSLRGQHRSQNFPYSFAFTCLTDFDYVTLGNEESNRSALFSLIFITFI